MILVSKNVKYEIRVDALRIGRQKTFRTRRPEFR